MQKENLFFFSFPSAKNFGENQALYEIFSFGRMSQAKFPYLRTRFCNKNKKVKIVGISVQSFCCFRT